MVLQQYCSNYASGDVHLDDKWEVRVWIPQDEGCGEASCQLHEGGMSLLGPV